MNLRLAISLALCVCANFNAMGEGPSQHMGDSARTAYVDAQLPAAPVLQWTYNEKHPPRHAWKEPNRELQYIDFDYATQTTIAHGMVFFGSSADHTVTALDTATGEEVWSFITEGPVRFAPAVHNDRVYVASDDGFLYCLKALDGDVVWKFRGSPFERKSIGNDQMISHWPARSGVLLDEGKLYFTAGMWSRDGVFIYCLDPADASVVWKNDTSGYHFALQPHSSGYVGVAPQGYLALHRDRLYVPTGRGAPACFDAKTGEFVFYENGHGYKPHQPGGSRVIAWQDWVIMKRRSQHQEENVRYEARGPVEGAATGLYALDFDTGKPAWSLTDKNIVAAHGDSLILGGAGPVIKVDINDILKGYENYWKDGKFVRWDKNIPDSGVNYTQSGEGKLIPNPAWMSPLPYKKWAADVGRVFVLMQAGETILAGGSDVVSAIDTNDGSILWQKKVEGEARGITVADEGFVVTTTVGKIYRFGAGKGDSKKQIAHKTATPTVDSKIARQARNIIKASGVKAGYALMLGGSDGQLLCELVSQSDLVVYCLEPDEAKIARARKMLVDAGLLGVRAAVHKGSFDALPYSPYVANLIVWGSSLGSGVESVNAEEVYRVLRPYGGVALQLSGSDSASVSRRFLTGGGIPDEEIAKASTGLIVTRGELPGAGQWTHAHADIGRTGCSQDSLTRLPLGTLWWGGPGPARIVSRHWRAPAPVFSNGVLFVQGQHDVFAVDAYNGREMWNRHLENVGRFPPTHRGGNIVADDDSVYCIQGLTCLRLDAQTGETVAKYTFALRDEHRQAMAPFLSEGSQIVWEYLGVIDGKIIGSLGVERPLEAKGLPYAATIQQSTHVFSFDKSSGQLAWESELDRSVSANAIVADAKSLYLLDRTDDYTFGKRSRRGRGDEGASSLKALSLETGKTRWTSDGLPVAWKALVYSRECVVAFPNSAEQGAADGDKGVGVFSSRDGKPLWSLDKIPGIAETGRGGTMRHTFVVDDTLFLPFAYDLRTGAEKLLERNPLTGEEKRFDVSGKNFCGTIASAEDLLIYRSASVGFAEINRDSGSHWLPETRPGCWITAIPAGGMVIAPEGYSTCICPYNFKTSMALIPVEREENWSVYLAGGRRDKRGPKAKAKSKAEARAPERVKALRLNLNAPGDQMDANGAMWLAWPRPVDPKNAYIIMPAPVEQTAECEGFRFNADTTSIDGTPDPWLYTSGLEGPGSFRLTLSGQTKRAYTVRFHFAETQDAAPGERVFDVKVQGRKALAGIDIARQAGGARKALVKEITGVSANGAMNIELSSITGKAPLLCSLEVIEE